MSIGIDLSNRSVAIGLNNKADTDLHNAQLENIVDNKPKKDYNIIIKRKAD